MPRIASLKDKHFNVSFGADLPPSYSVAPSSTSVNEGSAVTFNVATTNVLNGTTLYWTNGGTTVAGDFSENINSGSFTVTNGAGSVVLTLSNDSSTEGSETIIFQLRTGSTSGTIVATAETVTINDTSTTPVPSYSIGPYVSNVNEGGSVQVQVLTTNVPNGTVLYWTISHLGTNSADFVADSGSVTINNGNGDFFIYTVADNTTEGGTELFSIQLRTGSTSGPVVKTSQTVGIYDTSQTPTTVIEYMIVGGGGGGGTNSGGGGGGGGLCTNISSPYSGTLNPAATVVPYGVGCSYSVGIGGGGGYAKHSPAPFVNGSSGGASSISGTFGTIYGYGGGLAGSYACSPNGTPGGSGGGAAWNAGSAGSGCQGGSGGRIASPTPFWGGGGGGGSTANGGNASGPPARGGDGGSGVNWKSVYGAGGGGGGRGSGLNPNGQGGSGGYGGGAPGASSAGFAPSNIGPSAPGGQGGGGGGGGCQGGNGGSGVVIFGYCGPQKATGGSISCSGGYVYHTFTGAGTFSITG